MKSVRGSILILILWVLIILSILSIAVSSRSSGDIKLAKYESENIKALYLAKAGIIKMLAELNKDKNNYDSLNEEWNWQKEFSFGGGQVIYNASDETARLNLNSGNLKKENLLELGIDETISQGILDYKAKKGEKGFEFMEELFLVDGMTRDIYLMIKDDITIYRGNDPDVNINTAGERVLRALAGSVPLVIDKILEYRIGNDGDSGTEDDGIFTDDNFSLVFKDIGVTADDVMNYQSLFSVKSDLFRITVDASFPGDGRIMKHIVSVADRGGKIYYWRED